MEFNGDAYWTDAEDDRMIGSLWAEMSGGKCLFVMVQKNTLSQIDAVISGGGKS